MTRTKKISFGTVALILLLMLASYLLVPWQVKKQGIHWMATHTDRTLQITDASFNPLTLTLRVEGVNLSEPNSVEPFVRLTSLVLSLSSRSLIDRALVLDRIEVDDLFVNLEQTSPSTFNFTDFTASDKNSPPPEADQPFHFSLNNIVIRNGSIDFTDHSAQKKTTHTVRELNLQIPSIGNIPALTETYVTPQLSLMLNGSEIHAEGQTKPFHRSIETSLVLSLDQIDVAFYANQFPLPVPIDVTSGMLDAEIDLAYRVSSDAQPKLLVGGELALTDLDIRSADNTPLLQLPSMVIDLDWADLFQRDINLLSAEIDSPQFYLNRDEKGIWAHQSLVSPTAEAPHANAPDDESQPLLFRIGQFKVIDGSLHVSDHAANGEFRHEINAINLTVDNLSSHPDDKSTLSLTIDTSVDSHLAVRGDAQLALVSADLGVEITDLPLPLFNPYLPANISAALKSGNLTSALTLALTQQPDTIQGEISGQIRIADLHLQETQTASTLLTWAAMDIDGINATLSPPVLHINQVTLSDALVNILLDTQGRLNMATAATASQAPEQNTPEPAEASASPAEGASAPELHIEKFSLQNGTIRFNDQHLPQPFSTDMYQVNGQISGLHSDPERQATVELSGQLENHSPLTIRGTVNPLSTPLSTDLKIHFADIDLVPLSPYSGTHLGYAVDKGKLHLDLSYRIAEQKIAGQNDILLDQFTFGDAVASDQATALPVRLGVALLKDQNGEIHLDVPVSGDLTDPNFTVSGAIFKILRNLLVKAAASPFSLLASVIGNGEDLAHLSFESGHDKLSPGNDGHLDKLVTILKKRPGLTLEISAFVDREKDTAGLRNAQLQTQLRAAKTQQLAARGAAANTPDTPEIDEEEYPQLLKTVYNDLVGQQQPVPESDMEKLLLARIAIGDSELADLAKQRALQVRDALVARDDSIKGQLFLKPSDIYQPPSEGGAARVEFDISSK